MFIIEDGTGQGNKARVGDDNRLYVNASANTEVEEASLQGLAWAFPTDFVSLTTTASFTGLWYFVNSGARTIQVDLVRVSNSAGILQAKLVKNPTAGTLVSAGTAVTEASLNFNLGIASGVAFKKGVDAQTVTDGTLISQLQVGTESEAFQSTRAIIVYPGDSLALLVKPSVASTVASSVILFAHLGD